MLLGDIIARFQDEAVVSETVPKVTLQK